jgi:CheY-like chemotaxis protein
MNLVVNARDAMPEGGRIIITTAPVAVTEAEARRNAEARAGNFVCLRVTDTGCGMDDATLKRIFEPFFTTKEAGKGTGLGLATVYGIVRQHQGWVTVESEPGRGSTFCVFLPAAAATANAARAEAKAQPLPRGHETILLVEDEASLRQTTASFLRRCGYRVLEGTSGRDALAAWNQHGQEIDLLLSDMVMPGGMNGLQLALKLRSEKPRLKTIVTSGYSRELVRQNDLVSQGVIFLAKPCPPGELAQAVRRCLDQSPA